KAVSLAESPSPKVHSTAVASPPGSRMVAVSLVAAVAMGVPGLMPVMSTPMAVSHVGPDQTAAGAQTHAPAGGVHDPPFLHVSAVQVGGGVAGGSSPQAVSSEVRRKSAAGWRRRTTRRLQRKRGRQVAHGDTAGGHESTVASGEARQRIEAEA